MGDKPDYLGHRQRLREKFSQAGTDALHDYEIIELLLTYIIPRQDVKPIAKKLIEKFGSLNGVFDASSEELVEVDGIGDITSKFFPLLREILSLYFHEEIINKDVLSNPKAVERFVRAELGDRDKETFMAICVNSQNEMIDYEILQEGTVDHAEVYPRKILEVVLDLDATGLILVHNHPSGNLNPSEHDKKITEKVKDLADQLDLTLLDHLIVSSDGIFSFQKKVWGEI